MTNEQILEEIEKERWFAFLTLANTGEDKYDEAYKQVCLALDNLANFIKNEDSE